MMRSVGKAALRIAASLLVSLLATSVQAVDVTACGQFIRGGQIGILQADIDCSTVSQRCSDANATSCANDPHCSDAACSGLVLGNGATLMLNGRTLTDGAVLCSFARCTVVGPGTITGNLGVASGRDIRVEGGITIASAEIGINALRKASVSDVSVSNSRYHGISAGSLRAVNVQSNGNGGIGILVSGEHRVIAENLTVNDNGVDGVLAYDGLRARGLVATGNTRTGVAVKEGGTVLRDSTLTGNGTDLLTAQPPRLIDTVCGTSNSGVCSLD